jgi:hypothetical protein
VAPGGVLVSSDVNFARFHHTVGRAPGTLGLGLAQIFSSPPEPGMGGLPMFRPTYVPAYLRSGIPTFRPTYMQQLCNLSGLPPSSSSSSITSSSGTSIFLFYVIGIFFLYKIIFLFFLPSMQLKHVILTIHFC